MASAKDLQLKKGLLSTWLRPAIVVILTALAVPSIPAALADKADKELAPGLTYDAYLNFDVTAEQNYDLDRTIADGLFSVEPEIGFSLLYDPADWFKAFISLELSRRVRMENDQNKRDKGFKLAIKEAYVDFPGLFDSFTLRIGRQDFDDDLEWLYDQELDAVRLFYEKGAYEAEFSISQQHLFDVDLLNVDKGDKITNYLALVRREITEDVHLSAYVFYRDDHSFRGSTPEDLLFFGIQSLGKIDAVDYWLNATYVTGQLRGSDISGFGVDVGATYGFDYKLEPSITLGVAFGSGDKDPGNGKDGNFRQTDLQDNAQKLNGVESFMYLGEVLQPELSNLWVFTAGAGIRPTGKSSIDVVYHYYRQVEAVDELRKTDLDIDPNGTNKDLGHEIDLIFGYREIENVHLSLLFGVFMPGKAFDGTADNAYYGNFEINFAL